MIKKLLLYTFLFFFQLLSAQQKYNLSITGRASNYNEACANQNFVKIWVVYDDDDRALLIDHQVFDGYYQNYNVLVEYDSSNPIVRVYTENRRQTKNAAGCNNDHITYSHNYSITTETCWGLRINDPFERLGNDYLEFEVSPIVDVSHTDGSPPARPKIVCETDLVSLRATSGFTPADDTYHWEFYDRVNIVVDPVAVAEKQRLYQIMIQAQINMVACYSSGNQNCSEWVNDYNRARANYENYVVPGPTPIWRPITSGSNNINVALSDLYPSSGDYNRALGSQIDFRINPVCGVPSDKISAIFLPEPPNISTIPTITQPTCSYSEDGGFRVVFDRRLFSYETLNINLLKLNEGETPMNNNSLEDDFGDLFPPFLAAYNARYTPTDNDVGINTGHSRYNAAQRSYTWPTNKGLSSGEYAMEITGYRTADNVGGEIHPFCDPFVYFFNISAPTKVQFAAEVEQDETCFNANDGKIELTNVTGGSGSYYYSLNDGASWSTTPFTGPNYSIPLNLAPNTYNILVRDSNGCYKNESGSDPVPLTIKEVENDIVAVLGNIVRPGAPGLEDGVINITSISGGTPFVGGGVNYYEFVLKDAANTTVQSGNINTTGDSLTGLAAGNYTITYKDQNGCETDPISIPISDPDPIVFSIEKSEAICFNEMASLEVINITGGLGDDSENAVQNDYTVVWEKDGVFYSNGSTIFGGNGIYKAIVTDKRSGRAERSIEITDADVPQPIVVSIDNFEPVKCYGGDAIVTLGATGGQSDVIYQYSSDSGISWQDESTFNLPYKSTPYRFMARDKENISCRSESINQNINTQPTEILISGEATQHNNIFGGLIGALSITVSGGSLPYKSIVWSNSDDASYTGSGTSLSNLKAGFYQVVITDAQDCTMSLEDPIEITEPDLLEITSAIPTHITCYGESTGSIALTVTGGIPPYHYQWSRQGDAGFSAPDTNEITGLPEGTYQVTVTDESGSPATATTFVVINQQSQIEITHTQEDNICYNDNQGSIDLTVTGGVPPYSYLWSNGETTEDISGLQTGPYTVEVTDDLGCTGNYEVTIGQPADAVGLTFDVTQITAYGYDNGAIDITVTGGAPPYVYEWFADNGFTSADEDISGLEPGDYTLIVYDANYETSGSTACTIMEEFEIREPDELLVNISEEYSLFCYGDQNGELLANGTGGVTPYSYEWSRINNGTPVNLSNDLPYLTNIGEGTYRATITDANGIEVISEDYYLSQPGELILQTISSTDVLCYGAATGAIDMQVSGGVLPYTVTWNDGATTLDRDNLTAGSYSITVEDANNCVTMSTIEIENAFAELLIENVSLTDVTTFDGNDGAISLDISGGATPYNINWTRESDNMPVSGNPSINNLIADRYTVFIEDVNGCTLTETYTITQPDIVVATTVNPTCAGGCDGSISLEVDQGNGTYGYTWGNGSTGSTISGLCAGTYSVSITGYYDRVLERTYVITDPEAFTINIGEDRVLCEGQTHSIDATISDAGAQYQWTSDTGFSSASPQVELTQPGTYSLIVTNSLGCIGTDAITISRTTAVIGAEFAVSSQVFTGESVVLVDLSNPTPDVLEWILPEGAEVLASEGGYAEVVFNQAGEYVFGMYTELGECQAYQEKRVVVIEREKFTEGEDGDVSENERNSFIESYLVYPNPSDGAFTLEIGLSEEKQVSVRIFGLVNNAMVDYRTLQNRRDYLVEYDLRHVSAGIYFIVLETPVSTQVKKLIIE